MVATAVGGATRHLLSPLTGPLRSIESVHRRDIDIDRKEILRTAKLGCPTADIADINLKMSNNQN